MKYSFFGCVPVPIKSNQLAALLEAFGYVNRRLHKDYHLPDPNLPFIPLDHFCFKIAYDVESDLITAYLPARYSTAKTAEELNACGIECDIDDLDASDTGTRDALENRDLFIQELPAELQPIKSLLAWSTAYNFQITD
jgi:hypothetical protein